MQFQNVKHTVRNSIIFLLSITGKSWLYGKYVRRNGPLVRVVVFHDVPDAKWFESMIGVLTSSYNVISPEDFYTDALDAEKINVLVTFDDGYQSWMDVALPVLGKYGVKGIFFINSGLIDVAEDEPRADTFMKENLLITPKCALSWKGVRTLAHSGQTIGGHARTHANLTRLQDTELEREITDDKRILEGQLSQSLTDFAYPFGTPRHMNAEVILTVRDAGYKRAYTAISRFVPKGETFMIPRMCIETGLSPKQLRRWVEGGFDLFSMIKNICAR